MSSTNPPCHTSHPVLIRIYIEGVWQCMNCFTYHEIVDWARCGMCVPVMYAYIQHGFMYAYVCMCVCGVCSSIGCHSSGPPVRPPAGVHSVKAAAAAPVAPPCPPLGAPPNLPPGRLLNTHTNTYQHVHLALSHTGVAQLTAEQLHWWPPVSFTLRLLGIY